MFFVRILFLLLLSQQLFSQVLKSVTQDNSSSKYDLDNKVHPGICNEIITAVRKLNPELSLSGLESVVPISRIESMLETKKIDIFFCLIKSPEREKRFRFIDPPIYTIRHVVVTKKENTIKLNSYAGLKEQSEKLPVLVNLGSTLIKNLENNEIHYFDGAKDDEQIFSMLQSGRGQFFYGQDINLRHALKKLKLKDKYKILPHIFKEEAQYVAYADGLDPEIVSRIKKSIITIKQNGVLDQILSKYK